ncbi:alpha-related fimbriae minor subunit 1 [Yersinia frederiksenii]|nr:alpha-related fimbriae minor subunit 1 [Yersinia frederiksenii]
MKKILLSVMTIAILSTSTVTHSLPLDKYIDVFAEIPSRIEIIQANGRDLESLHLERGDDGVHSLSESVLISVSGGTGVNIKLGSPLNLVKEPRYTNENNIGSPVIRDIGLSKRFIEHHVTIAEKELGTLDYIQLKAADIDTAIPLVITAKEPANVRGGEVYVGKLHLVLEDAV